MNWDKISGVIRHLLTFGAGFFVAKGYVDDATATQIVSGLVGLVGVFWSIATKKSA